MGIFQKIKDGFFATKCIEQIKHVLPNSQAEAEQFCTYNLVYLTASRDKGMNYEQAVNFVCMLMLNSPEKMLAPDKTYGLESLLLASKYAACFVDRWENSERAPAFKQALQKYIAHIESDPITKDLRVMSDRMLTKPVGQLDYQFSTHKHFMDWQEKNLQKVKGKIYFETYWEQALYLNFVMSGIEKLSETINNEDTAKEFFDYMTNIVVEQTYLDYDEGWRFAAMYRCHDNEEVKGANSEGEKAMEILLDFQRGKLSESVMESNAYLLHDVMYPSLAK